MLSSLPDLQKERGFPFTPSRKKKLLKFKRESTCLYLETDTRFPLTHVGQEKNGFGLVVEVPGMPTRSRPAVAYVLSLRIHQRAMSAPPAGVANIYSCDLAHCRQCSTYFRGSSMKVSVAGAHSPVVPVISARPMTPKYCTSLFVS